MAGRIPKSFIDDLIARDDIIDVVGARGPLKKRGMESTLTALYIASGLSMLATALSGLLFYVYYWQWRGLFNEEGRYVYEPEALVFHDESVFLIVPFVVFALFAGVCLFYARLSRRKARGG